MSTDFTLPELGEGVTTGDVLRVLVEPGDALAVDQPVLELETGKATVEVPSSVAGTVKEIKVKAGDKVEPGQLILTVEVAGEMATGELPASQEAAPLSRPSSAAFESQPSTVPAEPAETTPAGAAPVPPPVAASPSVRRLARELGIDIHKVPGSGPNGRISIEDVKEYAKLAASGVEKSGPAPVVAAPPPDFSRWGEIERQPMRAVRRKTAEHVSAAWAAIPHVTQHDLADITVVEELRHRYASQAEASGGRLTLTAIVLKVVAAALKVFPRFNASIDAVAETIVYKKYIHIGVAVETDRGLLVPVIRDVAAKNILQLAAELTRVSEKARSGKLSLEEMQGGCFTITNLGGIGGTSFTPIVNAPEVAILGISRAQTQPLYKDGAFVPRLMLPLSLSYDHRVIDGADGARFLRWVAEALEQPFLLELQG